MPEKEFTNFDVAAAVRELKAAILDARVNNVYQLDAKTLLFKLHKTGQPSYRLILEAGRRMHLTSYAPESPSRPPQFCLALRKSLRDARLTDIAQREFERVVILSFSTHESNVNLIVELFGEGNFVLTNHDNEILQALIFKDMRDRSIKRGLAFQFAPSTGKNPLKVTKNEFKEAVRGIGDIEIVRAISRVLHIGSVYSEETLLRAGVDKKRTTTSIDGKELDVVFDTFDGLLRKVDHDRLEPCLILNAKGDFIDVVPIRLRLYESTDLTLKLYDSFNEALDEYYTRVTAIDKALSSVDVNALQIEKDRLNRIMAEQKKTVEEAESRVNNARRSGDLLYTHITDVQIVLNRFVVAKQHGEDLKTVLSDIQQKKKEDSHPWTFFQSFDSQRLHLDISVDDTSITLNIRKNLFENAAFFYEQAKKEKQRLDGAKKALEISCRKAADIETKLAEAEALKQAKPASAIGEVEKQKVRRKEWFEKFRWFRSSDGFLVIGGRDAVSNEVLIKKYTSDEDLVFHADIVGAPFVVIKTEGKQASEATLRVAAEFAASFSRGWREGFGSIDVYWVRPNQLSKAGPSGESVGRGSFVVRGERNWRRGTSLKLAVGLVAGNDGQISFTGGPLAVVKSKTDVFVEIEPGELRGKELFRSIIGQLASKIPKELGIKATKSSTEELRDFVPFGKARLVSK